MSANVELANELFALLERLVEAKIAGGVSVTLSDDAGFNPYLTVEVDGSYWVADSPAEAVGILKEQVERELARRQHDLEEAP
jgi:hypothetical protein